MKTEVRVEQLKKIRSNDMIPGIVYGHTIEPVKVQAPRKEFFQTLEKYGQTAVFPCEVNGQTLNTYIKEIQREVLHQENIIHFDLVAVSGDDKIHAHIPIHLLKKEFIEKQGLVVNLSLNEIEAKFGYQEKMNDIEIDVSQYKVGDVVRLEDLPLPKGVDVLHDLDTIILSITPPKVATESTGEESQEPELVGAKKE